MIATVWKEEPPVKKCDCGNQCAGNAKFCPKCGYRFTSGFVKFLAVIIGGFFLLTLAVSSSVPSTPNAAQVQTPSQIEAKKKEDIIFQRAAAGAKQLRESMRNPDSFKLVQALIMDDGAVCYEYRAANGFGGLNVAEAALSPGGQFRTSDSERFESLWNKECRKKTGDDKTWEVGYAAGLHGIFDKQ